MVLIRHLSKEAEEMIARGGTVTAQSQAMDEWCQVCLKITKKLLHKVDTKIELGTTRNAWIRDAIKEKLEREAI